MTVVIRDLFGGGDDADIAGRVPDTLSNSGAAHWEYAYRVDGGDTLAIESGALVPPAGVLDTVVAVVRDHGLTSPDYAVRKTASIAVPTPGLVFLGPALGVADDGTAGYIALLTAFDDHTEYGVYAFNNGSYSLVTGTDGTGPAITGPHTWELARSGSTLTFREDGTILGSGTDATYPGIGNPGLELDNTNAGDEPEAFVTVFEVDDGAGGGPTGAPPCASVLAARETFTGADDPDIATRIPDGGGLPQMADGEWLTPGSSVGAVDIVAQVGVSNSAGEAQALLTDLPESPCAQGAEVQVRFPSRDGVTGTPPWVEGWRYRITGNDGHPTSPVSIGTIEGYCDDLVTDQVITGTTINDFTQWPSGQPKTFTLGADTATVSIAPGSQAVRTIMFFVTAHVTAGSHTYPSPAVAWSYDIDPDFTYIAPDTNGTYSNIIADFEVGGTPKLGTEGGNTFGPTITPGSGTITDWDAGDIVTANADPIIHLRFTDFARNDPATSTGGGVTFSGDNPTGNITHTWPELLVDGVDSFTVGTAGAAAMETAEAACLVGWDDTVDEGYRFALLFDHTGGSPVRTFVLEEHNVTDGVTTMRTSGSMGAAHDVPYILRLVRAVDLGTGNLTLYATYDDGAGSSVMFTFDLVADVADETSAAVDLHEDGLPGFSVLDGSEAGLWAEVQRVDIIGVSCTGGADPGDPPYPPPPPEPQPIYIYRSTGLNSWDAIVAPTAGVPGDIAPRERGEYVSVGDMRIRDRCEWVVLGGDLSQMPPPDGGLPPGSDPCETLNPDPGGGDFPPIGDVSPVPYAGGRFFGLQGYPITLFNSVFNASQQPAEMMYFMTALSQASARNGVIVGAQGGYKKFIVGGVYSQAAMNAFIDSHAPYASQIKAYQDAGTLACIYVIDDQRVVRLWPPSGISDGEIARICARWLSVIPGIRLGIRARPRTFSAPIPGLSVYGAQYDGPMQVNKKIGDTVTTTDFRNWRNAECAWVRAWGIPGITMIMSPNALHGGDGESGVQYFTGTGFDGRYMFSAAEWVRSADGWYGDGGGGYADLIIGNSGYEYLSDLLPHTGLLDGMTYHRNRMMTDLPPL